MTDISKYKSLAVDHACYDKIDKIRGVDVTICTTAKSKEELIFLLESIGFPFVKLKNKVEG